VREKVLLVIKLDIQFMNMKNNHLAYGIRQIQELLGTSFVSYSETKAFSEILTLSNSNKNVLFI